MEFLTKDLFSSIFEVDLIHICRSNCLFACPFQGENDFVTFNGGTVAWMCHQQQSSETSRIVTTWFLHSAQILWQNVGLNPFSLMCCRSTSPEPIPQSNSPNPQSPTTPTTIKNKKRKREIPSDQDSGLIVLLWSSLFIAELSQKESSVSQKLLNLMKVICCNPLMKALPQHMKDQRSVTNWIETNMVPLWVDCVNFSWQNPDWVIYSALLKNSSMSG